MSDTKLTISVPADIQVGLLLTMAPTAAVSGGTSLVAATQTVVTSVGIDFDDALPVVWMAALQRAGELAPNVAARAYAGADDQFTLSFGNVAVTHDAAGWHLPHFDTGSYAVSVGFGVESAVDGLVWAYCVMASPGANVLIGAGAYQLVGSNGAAGVGDPFGGGPPIWSVPLGAQCTLTFDDSGVGTLLC